MLQCLYHIRPWTKCIHFRYAEAISRSGPAIADVLLHIGPVTYPQFPTNDQKPGKFPSRRLKKNQSNPFKSNKNPLVILRSLFIFIHPANGTLSSRSFNLIQNCFITLRKISPYDNTHPDFQKLFPFLTLYWRPKIDYRDLNTKKNSPQYTKEYLNINEN